MADSVPKERKSVREKGGGQPVLIDRKIARFFSVCWWSVW